jgi:hypothetical protein
MRNFISLLVTFFLLLAQGGVEASFAVAPATPDWSNQDYSPKSIATRTLK